MTEKTEKNIGRAFAAESKAAARNAAFASKADKEELPQIARLFRAISEAESVHARRFLLMMRGKVRSTEENLETAFENEINAKTDEYPPLIKDAVEENQEHAAKVFSQARDVEGGHAELYKKALNNIISDREVVYYVCQGCGYTVEDEAPEKCPVCGAIKKRFKRVE